MSPFGAGWLVWISQWGRREQPSQPLRDRVGFALQPPPGDTQHPPARRGEHRVADAVVLEGTPGPVGLPAVRFQDDALARPREVNDVPSTG